MNTGIFNRTVQLLSVAMLMTIVGCRLMNNIIESVNALEDMKVVDNLEPSEQYYLGRGVSAVIVDKYKPLEINDSTSEGQILYLNEMAGFIEVSSKDVTRSALKLGDYTNRSYDEQQRVYELALFKGVQVGILDTDEISAFATPGGFLWISRGMLNLCNNEDELAAVVGSDPIPRPEVVKKLWEYIKAHDLQNPANKREIVSDDKLRPIFGQDKVTMFEMNKLLAKHLT